MSKKYILEKIRELSEDGNPPGMTKFRKVTGVTDYEINKYWENWGEALTEAGYTPNEFNQGLPKDYILEKIICLIREKKKFPTLRSYKVKRNEDNSFPNASVVQRRIGSKDEQVKAVIEYCHGKNGYEDVLEICQQVKMLKSPSKSGTEKDLVVGYVYLIKFGDFFKIGRSNDFDRRLREIKTKLPEEGDLIHVIETDDPEGIEAYWHNRFSEKRARGEWFKLLTPDVKAFKKRKFM